VSVCLYVLACPNPKEKGAAASAKPIVTPRDSTERFGIKYYLGPKQKQEAPKKWGSIERNWAGIRPASAWTLSRKSSRIDHHSLALPVEKNASNNGSSPFVFPLAILSRHTRAKLFPRPLVDAQQWKKSHEVQLAPLSLSPERVSVLSRQTRAHSTTTTATTVHSSSFDGIRWLVWAISALFPSIRVTDFGAHMKPRATTCTHAQAFNPHERSACA